MFVQRNPQNMLSFTCESSWRRAKEGRDPIYTVENLCTHKHTQRCEDPARDMCEGIQKKCEENDFFLIAPYVRSVCLVPMCVPDF